MKALNLGTQTGSLVNHIISGCNSPKPEIGMGATILCWSDRHAGTVTEINKSGTEIVVTQDIATRTDKNGMSDCQSYDYSPDPNGSKTIFRLRKNGAWVRKGESMKNGQRVVLGARGEYYDFSF